MAASGRTSAPARRRRFVLFGSGPTIANARESRNHGGCIFSIIELGGSFDWRLLR
jgi:hypothetical protein